MQTTTPPADVLHLGLAELASGIAAGEIRAEDVARKAIERASHRQSLCGLIHLDAEALLSAARKADSLSRDLARTQPLHGVPLVFKDNIDVAGYATSAGSPALAGFFPHRQARLVDRLVEAGALVLGKANMHELSRGVTSENPTFGTVRNPAHTDFIAGGSSGGTAAAIAAGIVPAGVGTDTGGSTRIPAALCGIVGMRPTTGRWPGDGLVPVSSTLDTPGPMGRTVADCALLDSVVTGESLLLEPARLAGLRLGVPRAHFWECVDPAVAAVVSEAMERLKQAGVVLVECEGLDVAGSEEAIKAITRYEAFPVLRAYFDHHQRGFDAAAFTAGVASADVQAILRGQLTGSSNASAAAYRHALEVARPALQRRYQECFQQHGVEALAFPTTVLPAAPIGQAMHSLPGPICVPTFAAYTRNTGPAALAALPAISLPAGLTRQGLPVGLELDGPAGADRRLLSIAQAVESALR